MTKDACRAVVLVLVLGPAVWGQAPIGTNFQVNTYTTGTQSSPSVGVEPDGDFVIVWTSPLQDGDGEGVFGQRFDASGVARGGEFQVNTDTTGNQSFPDVAVGSGGDFIVVWTSLTTIQGRRYDAAGSPIGAEFQVNSYGTNTYPQVARAADGRFVVSWTRNSSGVFVRRFDASGSPSGDEFMVNTWTTLIQPESDVAVDANGNFVVVWAQSCWCWRDVWGQSFDAAGNRVGQEFNINGGSVNRTPSVSMAPAGAFVVAWNVNLDDYAFRDVMTTRTNGIVNTYTDGEQILEIGAIAHDGDGNFIVTWASGYSGGIFGQRFDTFGNPIGAEFGVNTSTSGYEASAVVGADAAGNFVVAWSGSDGQESGVFAQRFAPLAPASADIAVSITDSPDPVPLGANLVYTILVTNNGPAAAPNVQLSIPTPSGLVFLSNSGACTTPFPCFVGTVAVGQVRTITATYKVPVGYTGPNPILATASATATIGDPNLADNQATAQTMLAPPSADLGIVKSGPATIAAGSYVVYSIVVANPGPSDAAGVQVADPTPAGLTFVSNSGSCTTPFPCVLGPVATGHSRLITSVFQVPGSYSGPDPIVNQATVISTTSDPNAGNNIGTASTAILASADLGVALLGTTTVPAGSRIKYLITVANSGPSDAAGVQVANPTPTGLVFVSNSGSCTTPFPCLLGTIPAGQSRGIVATFQVPLAYSGPNPIVNQATVTSTTGDPNGANNAANLSTIVIRANHDPAAILRDGAGN